MARYTVRVRRATGSHLEDPQRSSEDPQLMRTFVLQRDEDVTGVSGTGVVAEGVQFSDSSVVVRWVVGPFNSTVVWPSIEAVEAVHGHDGRTRVVFTTGRL